MEELQALPEIWYPAYFYFFFFLKLDGLRPARGQSFFNNIFLRKTRRTHVMMILTFDTLQLLTRQHLKIKWGLCSRTLMSRKQKSIRAASRFLFSVAKPLQYYDSDATLCIILWYYLQWQWTFQFTRRRRRLSERVLSTIRYTAIGSGANDFRKSKNWSGSSADALCSLVIRKIYTPCTAV